MHFDNTCRFKAGACPVILVIKIVEKKKNVFGDIKSMLTRDQMKQVKGGSDDIGGSSGGGCCMTAVGNVSTYRVCGLSKSDAIGQANQVAGWPGGVRGFWCCASC